MKKITDQEKIIVDMVMLRISNYVESRKLDPLNTCLISDATMGFNMACDFIAYELKKIREATNWRKEDNSYEAAYNITVPCAKDES